MAEISVSYKPSKAHKPIIKSSEDVYFHLLKFFPEDTIALHETFVVGYLNRANRLIGVYELSKGGITGTVADPRLVLSVALKTAATGVVLCHNHPSGNMDPSSDDIELTRRLRDAGQIMGIEIIDHVIVGLEGEAMSFRERGLIFV